MVKRQNILKIKEALVISEHFVTELWAS